MEPDTTLIKLVHNAVNDGIWDSNLETGEIFLSNSLAEMLGYSIDEIKPDRRSWEKFIHPEDKPQVMVSLQHHLDGMTESFQVEYRMKTKPGDWKWILARGQVIERDRNGNPVRILGTYQDIDDRKHLESALKESEEKYRQLFENESDAIVLIDATTRKFLDANPAALDLYGYTLDELMDMRAEDLSVEPDLTISSIQQAAVTGSASVVERWHKRKDGSKFPSELSARVFNMKGRKVNCTIIRDIGDRLKAEEEQKELEIQLQQTQKLESLGILAGGIAHDFNNYLVSMLLLLKLARMDAGPDSKTLKSISQCENVCKEAQRLTEQLLIFSKGGVLVKKTVSMGSLLKDVAFFSLPGSRCECIFEIPDDLLCTEADSGQISQVIHNLILNADQAMPKGGIITLHAENVDVGQDSPVPLKPGKYVKVSVADKGIGIPDEHRQNIFDPFFSTKQKGSGLGLSTSFSIIKQHEGHITFESVLGAGTTFSFYLPATEREPILESDKTEQPAPTGAGRILIMDDKEIVHAPMKALLGVWGYDVDFAEDGTRTIELYRKAMDAGSSYDIVIIDLTIPGGMGGKEAIEKLLELDPDVKAIVSSGYSTDPVMANFVEYGFRDCLPKPYMPDKLLKVISDVLNG